MPTQTVPLKFWYNNTGLALPIFYAPGPDGSLWCYNMSLGTGGPLVLEPDESDETDESEIVPNLPLK